MLMLIGEQARGGGSFIQHRAVRLIFFCNAENSFPLRSNL